MNRSCPGKSISIQDEMEVVTKIRVACLIADRAEMSKVVGSAGDSVNLAGRDELSINGRVIIGIHTQQMAADVLSRIEGEVGVMS